MTLFHSSISAAVHAVETRAVAAASLLTLLVVATLAVACGESTQTQCTDLCTASQKCPGAAALDCPTFCADAASTASTEGCTSEFDDLMQCGSGVSNVCTTAPTCVAQQAAFSACTTSYCRAHPTATVCGASSADAGSGG